MTEVQSNLTRRTAAGLASTGSAMILTALFQIAYTAVMARLLTPREFGLVAMANVIIGFTSQLSRFGVGPALIQHQRMGDDIVRSATTLAWAFGATGTAIIIALSPVAGRFFREPAVVPVLMALAVAVTIAALALVPEALLRRGLRFQWLAGIDVASFAVGYLGVGIFAAWMGAGVWSLVAATLSQGVVKTLAIVSVERRGLRPGWSREAVRSIASFGSQVTIIGVIRYTASALPTMLVGRTLGSVLLGQFNRADMVIRMPIERLTTMISRVLFPALSTVSREPQRFFAGYSLATAVATAIVLPAAVFAALLAAPIVALLLGPGWEHAAEVLPLLAVAVAITYLTHFAGVTLQALGRLRAKLVSEILAVSLLLAGLTAFVRGGLLLVASVLVGVELFRFAFQFAILSRLMSGGLRAALRPLRAGLLLALVVVITILPVRHLAANWSAITTLAVGVLAAAAGVALAQLLPPVADLRREVLRRSNLARVSTAGRAATPLDESSD